MMSSTALPYRVIDTPTRKNVKKYSTLFSPKSNPGSVGENNLVPIHHPKEICGFMLCDVIDSYWSTYTILIRVKNNYRSFRKGVEL